MNSRERVQAALNHQEPDRVPLDLGSTPVTGMQVTVVARLRKALGLDREGARVKVVEPYQMLGEIGDDLRQALGVDTIGLATPGTFFGYRLENWKSWTTFDGTPVLVPGGFNTAPEPNGDILQYPNGDRSVPPSGRMPAGGYYFDSIVRQPPIDEANLSVEDNLEEFKPVSDEVLEEIRRKADDLFNNTEYAIVANFGGTGFGDIALVPAPWLPYPKGIRDVEEWYVSTVARQDHVYEIFQRQCEIALQNLERFRQAVGNRISVLFVSGTDFGTQRGPFLSTEVYRNLFAPFHRRVNDWVHRNTTWKTFVHSCGGVEPLIEEFIQAGFDILNPVQCSACGMEASHLKSRYGDRITFWGGGVDTQKTLPFGSVEDVRAEVSERIKTLAPGGGFIFNTIHNVQQGCPTENVLAIYETLKNCGRFSEKTS